MSDLTPENQLQPPKQEQPNGERQTGSGQLALPEEAEWELLLADPPAAPPQEPPAPNVVPPKREALFSWLKALIPLIVIIGYFLFKTLGGGTQEKPSAEFDGRRDLVDVKLPDPKEPDLQRQEKKALDSLIRELNFVFQAKDWNAVQAKIAAAPERLQKDETVRAFDLLARIQIGERSGAMNQEIALLRPYIAQGNDKRLLAALDAAEAKIIIRYTQNPEDFLRHTPRLRALIGNPPSMTQDILQLRIQLAEQFETFGDIEADKAGILTQDQVRLASARKYYQQALRWVTVNKEWMNLVPIDEGLAAQISSRVQVKLRRANERFHGPSLPFTGKNSGTWSGLKNEPLHDVPGGQW